MPERACVMPIDPDRDHVAHITQIEPKMRSTPSPILRQCKALPVVRASGKVADSWLAGLTPGMQRLEGRGSRGAAIGLEMDGPRPLEGLYGRRDRRGRRRPGITVGVSAKDDEERVAPSQHERQQGPPFADP